jgi:hypothetical protein
MIWVLVVDELPLIAHRRTGTHGRLEPGAERSTAQPNDPTARPPGQDKGKSTAANQHRQGGSPIKRTAARRLRVRTDCYNAREAGGS